MHFTPVSMCYFLSRISSLYDCDISFPSNMFVRHSTSLPSLVIYMNIHILLAEHITTST